MNSINIFHFTVLFALYSFMGWIIEVVYRSITQRKFINAGFLHGPFIPIYGFGSLFVIGLDILLAGWNFVPKIIVYGLVLTAVEYIVSLLFEKTFSLKLWDYSSNKFNLHGRICLLFSVLWTALALVFITFIHPPVARLAGSVGDAYIRIFSMGFFAYFAADFIYSFTSLAEFRKKIAYLYSEYLNLSNPEIEKIFKSLQRLREAFPHLNRYIDNTIKTEIKERINMLLIPVQKKIFLNIMERRPLEAEFYSTIGDICGHEEFQKLKRFFHHNSSIYEHVKDVAYLSYRICKLLKLDYQSAARGALLHDFFLYDWRNHGEPELAKEKNHGIEHPKIALSNAEKYFSLNDIEKDIIKKHMWPLTMTPPRYKESFIVSFADKYLSSKEFIDEFKKQIDRKRTQQPRRKRQVDED